MAPFAAALVVIVAVAVLGLGQLGAAAVRRARVDAVADVSALAAAQYGTDAAAAVASASGASVVRNETRADGSVLVEVRQFGVTSSAAAAARGETISGDPDPGVPRR